MAAGSRARARGALARSEAAHAVVAWLLGFRVTSIEIYDRGGQVRGQMNFDMRCPARQRACIAEAAGITSDIDRAMWVIFLLAGIEAELRLCPRDGVIAHHASRSAGGRRLRDHLMIDAVLRG
jgi:hypothetical protein